MTKFWKGNQKYSVLIQAFFLYCWLVNLQATDSYYSVYLLVAVAAAYAMHCNYNRYSAPFREGSKGCFILAAGFSLAVALANYALFQPLTSIQCLFELVCTFIGGWTAFVHILIYLVNELPLMVSKENRVHPQIIFWGAFGFLSLIYIVHLYAVAYPGVFTTDSIETIRQILENELDNHMPFYHTLTIKCVLSVGLLLYGEINGALAFVLTVQCIFMAACFSYAIVTLYQTGIPLPVIGAILVGYGILPYHVVYSATLWKDVLFGAAVLLMITALMRIVQNIGKHKIWNTVVFVIGSVGMCLWRTNGILAFGSLLLVMVLACRKRHKKLLGIMAVILVVCLFLTNPLLSILGYPGSQFVEALAIPFQQVSRVVALDLPLSDTEHQMLSEVFFLDLVKEKYDPNTVDPIKFETLRRTSPLTRDPLGYIGLWIRLGLKYPGTYLAAWVEETKGFWNGGYAFWVYIYQMAENSMGIAAVNGVNFAASIFKAAFRYLDKLTILQPLYSIGLQVWLTVLCFFVNVKKRRDTFLLSLPGIVIIAGLLIGTPVFAEFRYAYPIFTTLPVIVCSTVFSQE